MKKACIYISLIVFIMISICSAPALTYADTVVTLSLNRSTAVAGENVTASGVCDASTFVTIKGVDSRGNILLYETFRSDSSGHYCRTFKVPSMSGELTIVSGYGTNVAAGQITVTTTADPDPVTKPEAQSVNVSDSRSSGGGSSGNTISTTTIKPVNSTTGRASINPPAVLAGVKEEKKTVALTDIAGHWAENSIKQLLSRGAINGYANGIFKPDKTITRAEFTALLVKAFKLKSKPGAVFKDTSDHWAKDFIATAAANKLVSGYDLNTFGPDDLVTREQMAVMMAKTAKLAGTSEETVFADDPDISSWARSSVLSAVKAEIMKGYPDNTFKPHDKATRAEAVTVILNSIGSN